MKRILATAVVSVLWCTSAWSGSVISWSGIAGPGGGGNFRTADVSSTGRVMVGGDVSGLYARSGTSGSWTRVGTEDGLIATNVYQVKFAHGNPSVVVAATANACWLSGNSGQSFSTTTVTGTAPDTGGFAHSNVSALSFGYGVDTTKVVAFWDKDNSNIFAIAVGTLSYSGGNPTISWTRTQVSGNEASGMPRLEPAASLDSVVRVPIKIAINPFTTGDGTRDIYVLFGDNGSTVPSNDSNNNTAIDPNRRELWVSKDGGSTWTRIAPRGNDGAEPQAPKHPIDFAFRPDIGTMMVTCSNSDDITSNSAGSVWWYKPGVPSWQQETTKDAANNTVSGVTGAVNYNTASPGYWYVTNIQKDACPRNGPPAQAGIWRRAGTNTADSAFIQVDTGADWEVGWSPCADAMGQTISNVANSLSGLGEYWVTGYNVWRYTGTTWHGGADPKKYVRESTNSGSSPWNSRNIENVNCTSLYVDPSDGTYLWAGYYDIGLWRLTYGTGWTDQNNNSDSDWGGGDGFGGNVNSMLLVGNTRYVTESPSSKVYNYRLWKSVSGGSWSKVSAPAPPFTADHNFMRGMAYDGTRLFTTVNGSAYYDTSAGSSWVKCVNGISTGGVLTVAGDNGVVLAGGWNGIYRSVNHGLTWTLTKDLRTNYTYTGGNCFGDTAGSAGNTSYGIHREEFAGIHSFFHAGSNEWFAVGYMKSSGCDNGSAEYGLFRSADDGASWTNVYKEVLRRACAVDSCDRRMFLTSGSAFSSGPDRQTPIDNGDGCEILRATGSPTPNFSNPTIQAAVRSIGAGGYSNPDYRNPLGARVAVQTTGADALVWVGAPGYGVMRGLPAVAGLCSTERPGGGFRAMSPVQEGAKPPRTMFSIADARVLVKAGKLELYDVSGRKAKSPGSGVYFSVERNKAGVVTARRTVVVTP